MHKRILVGGLVVAVAGLSAIAGPACGGGGGSGPNDVVADGSIVGNVDAPTPADGSITIQPADITLDLTQGKGPPTQPFTVTFHSNGTDEDVSTRASFVVSDASLGAMTGNVFASSGAHGGSAQLSASFATPAGTKQVASATIRVRVHGAFQGPDCAGACPAFPPDTAPSCAQPNVAPTIRYPESALLLPPNIGTFAVEWTPFPGGAAVLPIRQFEIDFENAVTDVRVAARCTTELADTASPPVGTGGCEYKLDRAASNLIADSNRGGDPVKVTVRATTDGTCATPSTNSVDLSFAAEDVKGGIFYSKIAATGGVQPNIWAKKFESATVEASITSAAGTNLPATNCFGCHAVSRDGTRMTVTFADGNPDDEYGDDTHTLVDVATKSSLDGHNTFGSFEPGFQAIAPDTSLYLATNGLGTAPTNVFFLFDGKTGAALAPTTATIGPTLFGAGSLPARPTMPDWMPDGKSIVFVQPQHVGSWDGSTRNDDNHIFGGSIFAATFDGSSKTFGVPTALVTSAGENNYYPNVSPDGSFLVFDRVPQQTVTNPIAGRADCTGTGQQVLCPNDSFSNPKARVVMLPLKAGGKPVDAENANGSPAGTPQDVSNSWPRWSPFVQSYKGHKLLWMTFSSTRDYGLRVRNHKAGMFQCYPPDSLQQAGAAHNDTLSTSCQQPQIWMAAIDLDLLAAGAADPSFKAFWLPSQDETTHNLTAQWSQTVAGAP
jgi:hypothetical protein